MLLQAFCLAIGLAQHPMVKILVSTTTGLAVSAQSLVPLNFKAFPNFPSTQAGFPIPNAASFPLPDESLIVSPLPSLNNQTAITASLLTLNA